MPTQCDAACQKTIIDTGMPIAAAHLYARVIADRSQSPVMIPRIGAVDRAAPYFFADVVEIGRQVANAMNQGRETDDQKRRIHEHQLELCYRADYIIKWARMHASEWTDEAIERWTESFFTWAKEEQDFWTKISQENLPKSETE